jgi:outer membrane receptor protein involved in Fe transport
MFKALHWRRLLLTTAAAVPILSAGPSFAAEAAPATAVEEVIVTATRQDQALTKVPESISAFTAAKLQVLNVKSFADLAKYTPGVTFDQQRNDVSIRGVSSKAGSGTTGIYIDDTPIQVRALGLNANNTLPAVFDLDRVEVLRGPQGTLFGAGSEGGTVRYITPQPSLTTYSGFAHSEVAITNNGAPSYELGVAAGGPIVEDKLGFRLSAWGRRDGGWIDRVDFTTLAATEQNANFADTYVLRGALTWQPVDGLQITPGVYYQDRGQHNHDLYWVSISDPGAGRYLSGTPDRMADRDRFYLPSLKIEYDATAVRFISTTSYYDRKERVNGYSGTLYNLSYFQQITGGGTDPQGAPCPSCTTDPLLLATGPNLPGFGPYVSYNVITNAQQNVTQEFRLQSADPNARLAWVSGLFFAHNTQRSVEEIWDPQLPQLTQYLWGEDMLTAWGQDLLPGGDDYINDTTGHDRQIALFADVTYALTPQLKVNIGVRYAWTHFDFRNLNDGPQDLLCTAPGTDPGPNCGADRESGAKDETPLTPKFNVSYQITPDDMVYATVSKGYRIGGAVPPLPASACGGVFPTSYGSDTVLNYEVGAKGRFLDRTLQLSASAYHIKWKNIQQAIYVPTCGIQFTTNLGDATSDGFDLQGTWRLTSALTFDAAIGYTDAHYTHDALLNAADPDTGAVQSFVVVKKGDVLDVSPWTVSFGAQYNFTFGDLPGLVRLDYEFASRRTKPIPAEDPGIDPTFYDPGLVPDPATHELSMRAAVTLRNWDLAIYAENLLNAHPQLGLTHQDQFTQLYEATTLRPLTIGVAASYRF